MKSLVPVLQDRVQAGFTLIELLIAIVIVSVLSAIAIPNYSAYITRGNITDATARLATKQVQMEQWFQDNRTYAGGTGCTSDTTSSKFFDFTCTGGGAPSATAFTLSAAGKTGSSMAGFTFTIDQTGTKTTGAVPSGWSQPSPNTCWVSSKGGVC